MSTFCGLFVFFFFVVVVVVLVVELRHLTQLLEWQGEPRQTMAVEIIELAATGMKSTGVVDVFKTSQSCYPGPWMDKFVCSVLYRRLVITIACNHCELPSCKVVTGD